MKKLSIVGFFVVSALGTVFYFAYNWLPVFIFPKNGSIFERIKLVFFPYLFYFLGVLPFYKKESGELFASVFSAILISSLFIIAGFYTYSGILGFHLLAVDISLFYSSILFGFLCIYKKIMLFSPSNSIIVLCIFLILIGVFTYYPPNIAFFKA